MMTLKMTLAVAALVTIGLLPGATYADTITFTLANPNTSVSYLSGGSLTYAATVSAPASNSAAMFLNGDGFNITTPVTLNDSGFFSNFPLSLAPGASVTGNLFVATVAPNSPLGTYLGTFTLLGGANNAASSTLGTVNFAVTVAAPEPSSIVLLLTGMAGLAITLLRFRFKRNPRGWAR